jgi:hypothetical protein
VTRAFVCGVGAFLLLAGCQTGPPTIGDPPPTIADAEQERAYQQLLNRYSGQGEIYSGFTTELFAGATYQTWAFREARARRLAQFKAMSPEELAILLAKEREEWERFHEFELGAWTREPRYDDFDRKSSIWRLALVTDTVELLPVEVSRVARVNQATRALYPYMGEFWVRYRVRFPRRTGDGAPTLPEGVDKVTLRLASTLGRTDLRADAE